MINKDNYKILCLRNKASLCLDDLVALIVNSTIAFDLRLFSGEVMELTPGFTFTLQQAKALKKLTEDTLRQYETHRINDDDLLKYLSEARTIVKGENLKSGGIDMNFVSKLIHRKEIEKQASLDKMEHDYKDICSKILACEENMSRLVEASKGQSPDSSVYRSNERAYNNAKNQLVLLKKQEAVLSKALDEAGRIQLIKDFNKQQKEIARMTGIVLGDEKGLSSILAEAELRNEQISETVERIDGFGSSLLKDIEDSLSAPKTDSEFGAKVASSERRHTMLELNGAADEESSAVPAESKSEFASLVSSADDQTKE